MARSFHTYACVVLVLEVVCLALASAITIRASRTIEGKHVVVEGVEGNVWYDCSAEEGISSPLIWFSDVFSDPPVVTKDRSFDSCVVQKTCNEKIFAPARSTARAASPPPCLTPRYPAKSRLRSCATPTGMRPPACPSPTL